MKCIPKPGIAARTPALVYFIEVLVSITYEQDVPRYLLLFTSEVLGNKTVCIFLLFLWSYFPLLTLLSGLHRHSPVIWTDNMQEIPMPTSKHIWTKPSFRILGTEPKLISSQLPPTLHNSSCHPCFPNLAFLCSGSDAYLTPISLVLGAPCICSLLH